MKAVLASALIVGTAMAVTNSAYYIGNYTANGQVRLVPYPLGLCVPTGAVSGYTYSIFNCADDETTIKQKKFSMSDTTCSGTSTTVTLPKTSTRGLAGYANCNGPLSYMSISQYLSNCKSWKQGKAGIAMTVVAADACTYTGAQGGVSLYSRSTCTGDTQTMDIYAGDNTCSQSAARIPGTAETNDCRYFTTQGGLKVYSAVGKCVVDGVVQRCETPLASYEAALSFQRVDEGVDYQTVFTELFVDATVETDSINANESLLTLGFCSQYEDAKYASSVASLGDTVLASPYIPDIAVVCWTCTDYTCTNSSRCGTDSYCVETEQCVDGSPGPSKSPSKAPVSPSTPTLKPTKKPTKKPTPKPTEDPEDEEETTEEANSANGVYASFSLMVALLLSWVLLF